MALVKATLENIGLCNCLEYKCIDSSEYNRGVYLVPNLVAVLG